MHGRRFYIGCLQSPESTLLSMECPQELTMYAPIDIAFEQMQQDMSGNSGNSIVPYAEDLALLKKSNQDPKCVEDMVKLEMPRLFRKYW
ncbi:MAG: hypothetical protein QG574_3853 [Cyanobacteriota bacterium erpe_2018_sw_21hr_WHONDRS-SW48-000092_B_bin.40]|nr:hypothetical protein [Cyanobacteriota bacterium erpe_2018_sw_21hr_WHONDRS-SW48-000092_B_bin.40]